MNSRSALLIFLTSIVFFLASCSEPGSFGYEVPPPFERPLYDPETEGEPLFPIRIDGEYGYMNRKGEVVIEPQYELAYAFEEGIGMARTKHSGYVYLNTKGEVIWQDHDDIDSHWGGHFDDGLHVIGTYRGGEHLRAYINRKGETVIQFFFNKADQFQEGFAAVCVHDPRIKDGEDIWSGTEEEKRRRRWGFINTKGELITPFQYTEVYGFMDGMAAVSKGESTGGWFNDVKYGFIDTTGKLVIPIEYDLYGIGFHEGLVGVNIDGKTGYLNKKGEIAIEPQFDGGSHFSEGLAHVGVPGDSLSLVGFIDKTGELVIPPRFKSALDFKEGRACVKDTNDLYGMIDRQGNWVIPPKFEGLIFYSEGIAVTEMNGMDGYIDEHGNPITGFIFEDAHSFENGLGAVVTRGSYWHPDYSTTLGYVDREGNYVWEPQN